MGSPWRRELSANKGPSALFEVVLRPMLDERGAEVPGVTIERLECRRPTSPALRQGLAAGRRCHRRPGRWRPLRRAGRLLHRVGEGRRRARDSCRPAPARGAPVPRPGLGGPFWVDAPEFDVAEHVRPGPRLDSADEAGLLRAAEKIRSRRLDPSRPLWEIWVLQGLDGRRVAMFVRCIMSWPTVWLGSPVWRPCSRAAVGDGAPAPRGPSTQSRRVVSCSQTVCGVARTPSAARSSRRHPRHGCGPRRRWRATRELGHWRAGAGDESGRTGRPAPSAGAPPSSARQGGVGGPLERRHRQRRPARGDRWRRARPFHSRGEPVDRLTLPIFVPVSLRAGAGKAGLGNRISQMSIQLPVGEPDLVERLHDHRRDIEGEGNESS